MEVNVSLKKKSNSLIQIVSHIEVVGSSFALLSNTGHARQTGQLIAAVWVTVSASAAAMRVLCRFELKLRAVSA